jgi:biotin transport system substrate-specific component
MTTVAGSRVLADLIPVARRFDRALTRDAVLVTMGVLVTAAAAQIEIPLGFTPVPLTLQTFSVLLVGAVLGANRAAMSMGAYWLCGIVGLPFYSGGGSGWETATGATMGYLLGFIVAAWAVGRLAERQHDRNFATSLPAMLLGSAVIYTFGASWLSVHLGVPLATGEKNAISLGVAPFLVGDALKTVVAAACTSTVWAAINRKN